MSGAIDVGLVVVLVVVVVANCILMNRKHFQSRLQETIN